MSLTEGSLSRWRPLYYLNIYRLLLSASLVGFLYLDIEIKPFASHDYRLFYVVSFSYFIFSLVATAFLFKRWIGLFFQVHIYLITDICAILLLMHASGGVASNIGLLLTMPIVTASSIFVLPHLSYLYAAIASILVLLDQFYLFLKDSIPLLLPSAGILGIILFSSALIMHFLIRKLRTTEALASQIGEDLEDMEILASYMLERYKTPVFLVDAKQNIQLKNVAADQLLKNEQVGFIDNIKSFSSELSFLFQKWLDTNCENTESFTLKKSQLELVAQFSFLKPNNHSACMITLNDISELKLHSQQQKLAALGRLTASIAHEIRNPLSAISHASELLSESESLGNQEKRLTTIIENQSGRLNEIIDTVLTLSRRQQAEKKEIQLGHWIINLINEHGHWPQNKIDLSLDEKVMIRFDSNHLRQIVTNLIQNAFTHGTKTNEVTVFIKVYAADNQFILDIINEGIAIENDQLKKLFEPFYTTKSTGTGLGLYIAKELAEANQAGLNYVQLSENTICFRLSIQK